MDKILIELYLPAINRVFDIYIPPTCKLHQLEALLAGVLMELSDGQFVPSGDMVLCDRLSGQTLDINSSALELNLCNGSRLMLI